MSTDASPRSIPDADGTIHEYKIRPHRASQGIPLAAKLIGLLGGPAGGALSGVFSLLTGVKSIAELIESDVDWADFDGVAIGEALARAIASCDSLSLAQEMLNCTHRDSKRIVDPGQFDAAYTANYGELVLALKAVVEVNRFVDFSGLGSLSSEGTKTATSSDSPGE